MAVIFLNGGSWLRVAYVIYCLYSARRFCDLSSSASEPVTQLTGSTEKTEELSSQKYWNPIPK